jgi:hypothetical protein
VTDALTAIGKRIKTATQRLVAAVGGGAEADKNSRPDFRRFSDYQSFTQPERFIPADAIVDLERAVGEPVVTRELAELAGYDLVRREFARMRPADDPTACLRRLTADLGGVAQAEERAIAHVRGSANDARETIDELRDLIDTARTMIDAVERGVGRSTVEPLPSPLREARSAS